jgi:hypothetical protein|tara:strand:+ start:89 stop:1021 length:933 start_codon:yes stop_codon:yes gene_type:complete
MARHLLIGKGTVAVGYTAGKLADGAIDVQKESANGAHTSCSGSETSKTAPRVRIVQGAAAGNIYSPWIDVRNAINWSGRAGAAQVAQTSTYTLVGTTTAVYTMQLKVINITNGAVPFEFKNYDIVVPIGNVTVQMAAVKAVVDADKPHWIKTCSVSAGVLSLVGFKKGEVKRDSSIQSDLAQFKIADNSADFGAGNASAVVAISGATRGTGDPFYLADFEKSLQGAGSGFYNRIARPVVPVSHVDTDGAPADYDMYSLVVTKDGSTTSGINGVDNLIEITIAFPQDGTQTDLLEAQLNGPLDAFTAVAVA